MCGRSEHLRHALVWFQAQLLHQRIRNHDFSHFKSETSIESRTSSYSPSLVESEEAGMRCVDPSDQTSPVGEIPDGGNAVAMVHCQHAKGHPRRSDVESFDGATRSVRPIRTGGDRHWIGNHIVLVGQPPPGTA
jgi:hypothetical protein